MHHDPSTAENATVADTGKMSPTKRYVWVWSTLGLIATGYIAVAAAVPEFLAGAKTPNLAVVEGTADNGARVSDDALAKKLARLEQDLQQSRSEPLQDTERKQDHLERIAALEAKAQKAEQAEAANAPVNDDEGSTPFPGTYDAFPSAPTSSKQAADEIAERLAGTKVLNAPEPDTNTTTVVKNSASGDKAAAGGETAAEPKKLQQAEATKAETSPENKAETSSKESGTPAVAKAPLPEIKNATPEKVAAKAPPKAAPKPAPAKVAAKPKKPPLKTGSVGKAATAPISFGPAVVKRATRPIGVRIASGPSVDSLRLSWAALTDRHGQPLKQLQPRYVTGIGATGLTYDLIAGPFETSDEASQVCARLHANGARCALGEFTGNAL